LSRNGFRSVTALAAAALSLAVPGGAAAAARARFFVGAAKADITPTSFKSFYLGGYGIGPVHPATGVLRHIYARAIAIRGGDGQTVVIGTIDAQGYSIAYQQGPYGIADIEADIQRTLHIPADHVVLQSTHTHNGPDDLGVWGGVPDSYLAFVKHQMESAITQAVQGERPAQLRWATADMRGFSGTFGSDTDETHTGDNADYPPDNELRALQAVDGDGHVTATLVNYSTHPTVYGPLNKISPDWPGATATFLEHDEIGIAASVAYGYPGSVAVVTVGAVGHTWPAGTPRGTDPAVDPPPHSDNGPADDFGNAVARMAIGALSGHGTYLRSARVAAAARTVYVANTNPILLAGQTEPSNSTPLGGYKIYRANTPPYQYGDLMAAPVIALRVGDLPVFSAPGEAYPSIHATLAQNVRAPAAFVLSLAEDQLGYVEEIADYNGALQCSTTDEWFFTISPTFGSDVARLQLANAGDLGFSVNRAGAAQAYGPGALPPSLNCTQQQLPKP
jgi:hypothetical protein